MKNILIINGDLFKTDATEFLITAYGRGATTGGHQIRRIAIADMLFNFNRQFSNRATADLESDLETAWRDILWSNHIVIFCPVSATHIPSKVIGFFERLFGRYTTASAYGHTMPRLYGRSARIVSVLDDDLFATYMREKKPNFMAIKKEVFERVHINPVRTATLGHLHSTDNPYSQKWVRKLQQFGEMGI